MLQLLLDVGLQDDELLLLLLVGLQLDELVGLQLLDELLLLSELSDDELVLLLELELLDSDELDDVGLQLLDALELLELLDASDTLLLLELLDDSSSVIRAAGIGVVPAMGNNRSFAVMSKMRSYQVCQSPARSFTAVSVQRSRMRADLPANAAT